ncbi:EamA family transporter RarD [Rodentibacter pneumotropicus]|uniref:EamA family transporter RarD n=1 Tax=Rodentibacter pneumotropicus TaxID=758 RepID=UPI000987541C|nr:EamA family transporter RarD [Rodentibacter pneumotropicus]OOF60657.1 permease [Rodentibacter pneumotropicus]THA18671.1 EamA family transporter RarD [Rodentibacter pneumotropicus]
MLKGILVSLLASFLFGYMYYFSTLLKPLSGTDIFGYRMIFTFPFVVLAVLMFKQKNALIQRLKHLQKRPRFALSYIFCGVLMGFQMWLFLWAPNNGSSLSVSFGYLLLPIVMVAAGRLIFKERISTFKLIAVLIASLGVVSNIVIKGGLSWEAIVICVGYTSYFSIRKALKNTDLASFCLEMLSLIPISIYFALQTDFIVVEQSNSNIWALLVLLGLISGTALIAYVIASNMLPMNLLGLLGYVETIMMVFVSFFIGEKIDAESYPLFICLVLAMSLVIIDGVYKQHAKGSL